MRCTFANGYLMRHHDIDNADPRLREESPVHGRVGAYGRLKSPQLGHEFLGRLLLIEKLSMEREGALAPPIRIVELTNSAQ